MAKTVSDIDAIILQALLDAGAEMHGFDIGQELASRLERDIGPGTYYRALHRLERNGLVSARWETDDEASCHQGPPRRYYDFGGERAVEALTEYRSTLELTKRALMPRGREPAAAGAVRP